MSKCDNYFIPAKKINSTNEVIYDENVESKIKQIPNSVENSNRQVPNQIAKSKD